MNTASNNRKLKLNATIYRDVKSICEEACHLMGLDITDAAVDVVLDVFHHKLSYYANDLEKFAKHAKRSVINSDDCLLLTRRNPALAARLNSLKLPSASGSKESSKRRRTTAASSPAKRARLVVADAGVKNTNGPIDLTFESEDIKICAND